LSGELEADSEATKSLNLAGEGARNERLFGEGEGGE